LAEQASQEMYWRRRCHQQGAAPTGLAEAPAAKTVRTGHIASASTQAKAAKTRRQSHTGHIAPREGQAPDGTNARCAVAVKSSPAKSARHLPKVAVRQKSAR
jgi:hypothetical protein